MERRLLSSLNAVGRFVSVREHRLLFEAGNPENSPPPVPQPEQGGVNDFNRLYAGREDNPNARERTYTNVFDRTSERQAKYTEQVAKLTAYIQSVGGNLETSTAGTRATVTGLIERLQGVYQQTYVNSAGQQVEYREGLYNTVNNIETAYRSVEATIASIEVSIMQSNGGNMPAGLPRYEDLVRAYRTQQALLEGGPNNGSVDVRTYSVPFARESASLTSTYSLLRVPSNFNFNFGANPDVARILAGNYDMQGGMSSGVTYLRINPAAATQLAGLSVPVTVYGMGNTVAGTTTATFNMDGPIAETPNAGNTLIRITYAPLTRTDGGAGPDLPTETETPEQREAREEGERAAYYSRWQGLNGTSNGFEATIATDANVEDTAARVAMYESYVAAMGAEGDFLNAPTNVTFAADDQRGTDISTRRTNLPQLIAEAREALAKNTALAEFKNKARTDKEDTEAKGKIANAPEPGPDDLTGWTARVEAANQWLAALNTELGTLNGFAGSPGASVATETYATIVADRLTDVNFNIPEAEDLIRVANEGRDAAECNVFENEWKVKKERTDNNQGFYEGSVTNEDQVGTRIQNINDYIEAMADEETHLGTLNAEVHQPGDPRLDTYYARTAELATNLPAMREMLTKLEAYQTFEADAALKRSASEGAIAAIIADPGPDDLTQWEAKKAQVQAAVDALTAENGILEAYTGSVAESGAVASESAGHMERYESVMGDLSFQEGELSRVSEMRDAAECNVFENEWKVKRDTTEGLREPYQAVIDGEDIDAKVDAATVSLGVVQDELDHLNTLNREVHQPGDPRLDTYDARVIQLNEDLASLQEDKERFEAFQAFDLKAEDHEEFTEESHDDLLNAEAAMDALHNADTEAAYKGTVDTYVGDLQDEKAHLEKFTDGTPTPESGATETQAKYVADRLAFVNSELEEYADEIQINPEDPEAENVSLDNVSRTEWQSASPYGIDTPNAQIRKVDINGTEQVVVAVPGSTEMQIISRFESPTDKDLRETTKAETGAVLRATLDAGRKYDDSTPGVKTGHAAVREGTVVGMRETSSRRNFVWSDTEGLVRSSNRRGNRMSAAQRTLLRS